MHLPALPSSYPLFDWSGSNGSATAEQTQAAYTAMTSQGPCSDFSRFVWNDLVDTLSGALTAAGLAWNESYGTAESAKITSYLGALTAQKFNNVRHNIQNLINATWPWEFNPTISGYLGRVNMRGVSSYGANADILYGWYIEELAKMINITIQVLRNDEILSRMVHTGESQTFPKVDFFPAVAGFMAHKWTIESDSRSDLLPAVAGFLNSGTSVLSGQFVAPDIFPPDLMASCEISCTAGTARLWTHTPGQMAHQWASKTTNQAALVDMMFVSWLRHRRSIQTSYQAKLVFSNSYYASSAIASLTAAAAALDRVGPLALGAVIAGITANGAAIAYHEPWPLLHSHASRSYSRAEDLQTFLPAFFLAIQHNRSTCNADTSMYLPRMLQFFQRSGTEYQATAGVYPSGQMESQLHAKTSHAAPVSVHLPKALDTAESSHSVQESAMLKGEPEYLQTESRSNSTETAEIIAGQPQYIKNEDTSRSAHLVFLDPVLPEQLAAEKYSVTANSAQLHRIVKRNLKVSQIIRTAVHATLSFYQIQPEEIWFDPIQNGSDLYIRSAWLFWNDGDKGHIDTDVWYEVIREGSNLYIRSVDSSYQDREAAFIDLSLWLSPIQEGENLRIRSADTVWTDGDSANIDTAFFLEPVQEGSNLYIRQNIFGGE